MILWLARRFVEAMNRWVGLLLALLPLLFTGKAMLLGQIYGPADLAYASDPWRALARQQGIASIANPILSDLAFANLPWRAAVREALVNGRFPSWNRFVLSGNPLLATAQAAVFHPSTWLAIFLPVPLSWTFSCTFTIFLSLLSAYLFFRDFRLSAPAALLGAVGWGFSTYLLFWNGWSVGPSMASFPLLLLGLRWIAGRRRYGVGVTVLALLLSFAGGHPESVFHCLSAAAVYLLWELFVRDRRQVARSVSLAVAAGLLALLFAAPQLFPLLEAIPQSAEYRARTAAQASGHATQSVSASEAARRLLPDLLPFAYGIYGKSLVQADREDGSGMPLGYSGAVLFPLAAVGLFSRAREQRGRSIFLAFLVVGLLLGASAPGLLDLLTRLPGFALALNYRLVFLSALGLSGLAALGAEHILRNASSRRLVSAIAATVLLLAVGFALSQGIFRERGLSARFVNSAFGYEVVPLMLFAVVAVGLRERPRDILQAALICLVVQRGLEMGGTYPTLPASAFAPRLPTLETLPPGGGFRIAAAGDVFRPNEAALYGLEDVRGYESLVLDQFAETFPLWSHPQPASFNRIDSLERPFLSFLNVRFALAPADASVPAGWREYARGLGMAIFENPQALARAFLPRRIRSRADPSEVLVEMSAASDFSETVWVESEGRSEESNRRGTLSLRAAGPDLYVTVESPGRVFVATSLPNWPGWIAEDSGGDIPILTTDHAFVGFWLPAGSRSVRLHYRPRSFSWGVGAFAAAALASALAGRVLRRLPG